MALDMTLAFTLGTIALGLSIPLGIKFAPRIKKAFTKAQQGDASTIQTGSISGEKAAIVLNTGNGNNILNNSGTIITPHRSTGETEKLTAKREIQTAFIKFFHLFLGNEKSSGMLTHKPNLNPKKPNTFASHYESSAQRSAQTARDKLKTEVHQYAPVLENIQTERSLDALVQKLLKIKNLFEITQELRKSVCAEVDIILDMQGSGKDESGD
ncbi:MAG: hypothetical protein Q8L98_00695 [Chlamydiales bacterium]|nr:hypothetical protein [Chlamydiales bacterium]